MNIQDLGATGIIGIVILAFAVIGFLKGLMRTVLAMVCLGIAGYTALWANEHASDLTGPWISNPGLWLPKIVAVITGLVAFFICRYLLNFIVDPFNRSKTGKRIGFGLPAALLSLCSGLTILWLAFTGIRYGGSLAELRYTQHLLLKEESNGEDSNSASSYAVPLLLKAKHALDASSAGKWHQSTDPFYAPGKLTLCQILVVYHHMLKREKLLEDPALNNLLNNPAFLELAYQENVKANALSPQPRRLFTDKAISQVLTQPDFMELLLKVDSDYLTSLSANSANSAISAP